MVTEHFIQEHFGAQKGTSAHRCTCLRVALLMLCATIFLCAEPLYAARKISTWEFTATAQWASGSDPETLSFSTEAGKTHTLQSETLCGRAQMKDGVVSLDLGTWREHRQELSHPDAPVPRDCVVRTTLRLACPSLPCAPANTTITLPAPPPAPRGWQNLPPTASQSLRVTDVRVVSTTQSVE